MSEAIEIVDLRRYRADEVDSLTALAEHLRVAGARCEALIVTGGDQLFWSDDTHNCQAARGIAADDLELREWSALQTLLGALRRASALTIAAIPGRAVGTGFAVAIACDLRIVEDGAAMALAWDDRSLPLEPHTAHIVPHLVGWSRAMEIFLDGREHEAAACVELGLASRAVGRGEAVECAMQVARAFGRGAGAVRAATVGAIDASLAKHADRAWRALVAQM